jgi:thioredoxin reductase (NADPH)
MADERAESTDEETEIFDLIIIGGGPGGMSAAIYAARAKLKTLVLDKNPMAGALGKAKWIVNYPGFAEPIQGHELLSTMRKQAEGFGAIIKTGSVAGVNLTGEVKEIYTNEGTYKSRSIIIATGSMGRKPTIPGEADLIGAGVSYCATCDAPFFKEKVVAAVGDLVVILKELDDITRFVGRLYLITSSTDISEEHRLLLENDDRVKVFPGHRLKRIVGEDSVKDIITVDANEKEHELSVDGVFIYLTGAKPISDFLLGALELDEQGFIKTNPVDMSTSLPGIFAIGDVTNKQVRQVVVATGEGCIAALSADRYIHERKRMRVQWGG